MKIVCFTALALLACLGAGMLLAPGLSAPKIVDAPARPGDEAAVRQAAQQFASAFEKGDAQAVAALCTEEMEYISDDGEPLRGRAAVGKAYTEFFSKRREVKVESKTNSVRFLGKDTAIEEGTFIVRARDMPAASSRYSALYVRQDGRWLIALLKEWGDEKSGQATLVDLGWLVGTWEGDGPELQAKTTYHWDEGKKFLRSHYTLTSKKEKKITSSGFQIIGMDAALGLVRAWTFDSEGGFGESFWAWDGERWVIDSTGQLADGLNTTALNFLTRTGDDSFTWRSVKRTLDGQDLPDLPTVKVQRVKESK